jgi:hypothetical protein
MYASRKFLEKTLSAMACPRMARKTGAHGKGCDGLCDKGEPGFLHLPAIARPKQGRQVRGDFFCFSFVWQTKEIKDLLYLIHWFTEY